MGGKAGCLFLCAFVQQRSASTGNISSMISFMALNWSFCLSSPCKSEILRRLLWRTPQDDSRPGFLCKLLSAADAWAGSLRSFSERGAHLGVRELAPALLWSKTCTDERKRRQAAALESAPFSRGPLPPASPHSGDHPLPPPDSGGESSEAPLSSRGSPSSPCPEPGRQKCEGLAVGQQTTPDPLLIQEGNQAKLASTRRGRKQKSPPHLRRGLRGGAPRAGKAAGLENESCD